MKIEHNSSMFKCWEFLDQREEKKLKICFCFDFILNATFTSQTNYLKSTFFYNSAENIYFLTNGFYIVRH